MSLGMKRKWEDDNFKTSMKKKFSEGHKGKCKPIEVREKIRQSGLGKHNHKGTCPSCGLVGGLSAMKRWHFSNCGTRDSSPLKSYRRKVQTLTEQNYKIYKHIINPHDYTRTKCGISDGYQLDHIIPVKIGFDTGLSIHEMADVKNLQMLSWKENRIKSYKHRS